MYFKTTIIPRTNLQTTGFCVENGNVAKENAIGKMSETCVKVSVCH